MAIYLDEGGTTLAPAGWSDDTGLVDDAEAVIESGQQAIITALDQTGIQTNGIHYLHVPSAFTGDIGSGSAGSFTTKFDATYTSGPNIKMDGGRMYLTASNTCAWVLLLSGDLYLTSGTFTLVEVRGGTLHRAGGVTITTLDAPGGRVEDVADNSTTLATANVGGVAEFRGVVTTLNQKEGGRSTIDYTTGPTTINFEGGRVNLLRGGATTVNGRRGILDTTKAKRAQTVGTLNRWPDFVHDSAGSASLTTVTTTVDKVGGPRNLSVPFIG